MLRVFFILLITGFFIHKGVAQVWVEDFTTNVNGDLTLGDNNNDPPATNDWSVASSTGTGTFSFQQDVGNALFTGGCSAGFSTSTQSGQWQSEDIIISGENYVEINVSIEWFLAALSANASIQMYYELDNSGDLLEFYSNSLSSLYNDDGTATVSQIVKGSTLTLYVNIQTSVFLGFSYMSFTDISVDPILTIYSFADGNWSSTASWSYDDFSVGVRSSCSCTPSSSEAVIVGNGNVINVNGNGDASGIEVQSGSTLQWTSNFDLRIYRGGNVIVQNGGFIDQNGQSADISFSTSGVVNSIQIYDATNGLDLDRILIQTNGGNVTVNIEGDGRINLDGDFFIGNGAFINNSVINSFTGAFSINRIRFNSTDNSFTNSSGSVITTPTIFVANNGDDDNIFVNHGMINVDDINFNNADFTFENYGTINMTDDFINYGGTESISNFNGATWNYSGSTTGTGNLELYLDNGTNTFNYERVGDQEIIVPQDNYSNLLIDGGGTKTLAGDVDLGGVLTLTDGIVNTNGFTFTFLSNSATVSGGSNSSYIDGPVAKLGNGSFTFPTGDGGIWARVGISGLSGANAATEFTAEYSLGDPGLTGLGSLNNVSVLEGWTLNHTAGAVTSASVTLYFEDANRSEIDDLGDLVVARHNGTNWVDEGQSLSSANSVTSNPISSFSPFTFGSNDAIVNPLPVTLLNFDVEAFGDDALVTWSTASEENNDFFSIERSLDGVEYERIGTIKGSGTTHSVKAYQFVDEDLDAGVYYYRLKQTDFDGTTEYFRPDFVEIQGGDYSSDIILYPNPVMDSFIYLDPGSLEAVTGSRFNIVDLNGRIVQTIESDDIIPQADGSLQFPLDSHCPPGIYVLVGYLTTKRMVSKSFVIQ